MTSSTNQAAGFLPGSCEVSSWEEYPLFHATRLCLGFLQGLFMQAPAGTYRWDQDPEVTELTITDEAPLEPASINQRPAIITVRGATAFAGVALDQLQDYNFRTGERTHTDMISGNMTFNCVSRRKVVAENLGWLVARHCWILRRMLLKQGFHDFGQRIQIGTASPPGAIIAGSPDPEMVAVPVIVPFHFQYEDTIGERDVPLASAIETHISTMGPVVSRPTQVAAGGSPGPGLRGSATGARNSGLSGLRHPSISGRPIREYTTDTLPDSQQPAEGSSPLNLIVRT